MLAVLPFILETIYGWDLIFVPLFLVSTDLDLLHVYKTEGQNRTLQTHSRADLQVNLLLSGEQCFK